MNPQSAPSADVILAGAVTVLLWTFPASAGAQDQRAAPPPPAPATAPPVVMTVQSREAPLLRRQRMIGGGVLLVLREGDLVDVVDSKQAASVTASAKAGTRPRTTPRSKDAKPEFVWYHVAPHGSTRMTSGVRSGAEPTTGYMHHSDLIRGQVVLKAMPGAPTRASASEIALGGRGFDEIVEQEYRQSHGQLASAFAVLDEIDRDAAFNPTLDEVTDFVAQTTVIGAAR